MKIRMTPTPMNLNAFCRSYGHTEQTSLLVQDGNCVYRIHMAIDINTLDIRAFSVSQLRKRYSEWSAIRSEYLDYISGRKQFNEQDADRIATSFLQIETTLVMSAASRNLRVMTAPRLSYLADNTWRRGQSSVMLCPRSQAEELTFGDYGGEFCLSAYIDAEGLPHVPDDFWEHIVALSKYEGFKYSENGSPNTPTSESKTIRRSGRSEIYKLIRDFTLYKICGGHLEDMGWLEVKWPIETEWEILLNQFEDVFSKLIKMNSILYRIRYLEEKRLFKKYQQNSGANSKEAN